MSNINAYMHITLPTDNTVKNDGSTLSISIDFRESEEENSEIIAALTGVDIPISFVDPFGRVYDLYKKTITNGQIAAFNFTASANHIPQVVHFNERYIDTITIGSDTYKIKLVDPAHKRFFVYSV